MIKRHISMQDYSTRKSQPCSYPIIQGGNPGFELDGYQKKIKTKPKAFGPYIVLHTIGEGEFAKVKLALHKETGQEVAIKLVKKEWIDNQIKKAKIVREITSLRAVNHNNIVRLFDVIESENHIGLVLEYASGGELFDYIMKHKALSNAEARRLFAQLILAVSHLHKNQIVHRDLKLENLLLDKNRNVKVTDFGFANHFDEKHGELMITSCGSPCYAAPELVVSNGMYVGTMVDVWSCGVILFAMVAGYLPFDDDDTNPNGENINQLYKYILSKKLEYPSSVGSLAQNLLERILVSDPTKRATLAEIRMHPWLAPHRSLFAEFNDGFDAAQNVSKNNKTNSSFEHNSSDVCNSGSSIDKSKTMVSNLNSNNEPNPNGVDADSSSWLNKFAKRISTMTPNNNPEQHPHPSDNKEAVATRTQNETNEQTPMLKQNNSKNSRKSIKPVASIIKWFSFKRSNVYYCKMSKYPLNNKLVFKGSHSALTSKLFICLDSLQIITDVDYRTTKTPIKKIVCTRPKIEIGQGNTFQVSVNQDPTPKVTTESINLSQSASNSQNKSARLSASLLSCFYLIKKSLTLTGKPTNTEFEDQAIPAATTNSNSRAAAVITNEKNDYITSLELPSAAYRDYSDINRIKLVIRINLIENTKLYCLEFARLKGPLDSYNHLTKCIVDKLDF
ncbi:hypothetical protein BB561_001771 [Smittium simulii]|uniref:Protein kinase domain-containing protein n=1 Tax=Smittium simulii TaxID=133385 RepID=A0A2T9YT47_9FUNG|nr:hypothetical protein BB561_001771 [Smittium simulii]